MKKTLSILAILSLLAAAIPSKGYASDNPELGKDITVLQKEWAAIKYKIKDQDKQEKAMEALARKAHKVTRVYPKNAEPLIWEGIIVSTYAGMKGGLGALGLVKRAKGLLENAEKINSNALKGSIYTSLGSLYYQVPGWPIGFGDDQKARAYLEQAVSLNPDGMDPNYFYGDFLIEAGEYQKAIAVLEHALKAQDRPNRAIADAGRREEIRAALAKAKKKLQ